MEALVVPNQRRTLPSMPIPRLAPVVHTGFMGASSPSLSSTAHMCSRATIRGSTYPSTHAQPSFSSLRL